MNKSTVSTGIKSLYSNRALLRSLVTRDLQTKYRGTILGFVWVVIYPLTMLAVYSFVFGVVFKARWGVAQGQMSDFVLMLFCGLIIYTLFSETLNRAPISVVSKASFVKKVVFPLELLPTVDMFAALFNAAIGFGLLTLFLLIKYHTIPWTIVLLPLIIVPLLLLIAGLAWFLSAVGVFLRDISQVIGVVLSVMMFLSPVFYPVSALPALAQRLIYLNPLTYPMEASRQVLIQGTTLDWLHWLIYTSISLVFCLAGLWVFQRARPAFADVI